MLHCNMKVGSDFSRKFCPEVDSVRLHRKGSVYIFTRSTLPPPARYARTRTRARLPRLCYPPPKHASCLRIWRTS